MPEINVGVGKIVILPLVWVISGFEIRGRVKQKKANYRMQLTP
jgi:hypothetical protein